MVIEDYAFTSEDVQDRPSLKAGRRYRQMTALVAPLTLSDTNDGEQPLPRNESFC